MGREIYIRVAADEPEGDAGVELEPARRSLEVRDDAQAEHFQGRGRKAWAEWCCDHRRSRSGLEPAEPSEHAMPVKHQPRSTWS